LSIRIVLSSLFIAASLIHLSCSDSPSSIGANLLSQDLINILELNSSKDSLFQSSSVHKKVIALSGADRLLLGKKGNVEAAILIKFLIYFADSIKQQIINNELSILSAKIEYTQNYTFGNSTSPLDYSVHKINSDWSLGFTSDSLPLLSYDANDVSSNKVFSDSVNTFEIETPLVLNWMKSIADTNLPIENGIFIKPLPSSEKIAGFYALSITPEIPVPLLNIIIEKAGVYTDTLSFFPSVDLSVISGSLPDVGNENIGIQAGLTTEARIFFDISKLPKDIIINYAQLTLTLDTTQTITGSNYTNSLRVNYLTDSSSLTIDSSYLLVLNRDGNTFKGSITSYIQRALIENINNGLLISPSNKIDGVELFAIKSSNASVLSERPNLQIIYTSKNEFKN